MHVEDGKPGPADLEIEIAKTPQERVLELVYEQIPKENLAHSNNCVRVLKLRRDTIIQMAPQIGAQARKMWDEEVVPVIETDEKVTIPTATLIRLCHRLSIVEKDEENTEEYKDSKHFSLGFSQQHRLRMADMEDLPFSSREERNDLFAFYEHDRYHLYPRSEFIARLVDIGEDEDGAQTAIKIFPQDFEHLQDFVANFENILALGRFPHDFFAAIIQQRINSQVDTALEVIHSSKQSELEDIFKGDKKLQDQVLAKIRSSLTGEIDEEEINIGNDIIIPIAQLLRMRYGVHDYALVTQEPEDKNSNYIQIQSPTSTQPIRMNYGILTSVIYNLAKNAIKATDADMRRQTGEATYERYPLYVRYGYQRRGATVTSDTQLTGYNIGFGIESTKKALKIIVSDFGVGIDTDQIIKHAAMIIQHAPAPITTLTSRFIKESTLRTLVNWSNGEDFALRVLKLGQVWDLLGLPRLSGFNATGMEDSSGLGLWGIAHLIGEHGGKLEVTKRSTKGTSFRVSLPT